MRIANHSRCIVSPMAWGNGAYVLHKMIERHMPNYKVKGYNPFLTLMPMVLPFAVSVRGADLIHTVPDYGVFFYSKEIPTVVTIHHYMCDGKMDPYSSIFQKIHQCQCILRTRSLLHKVRDTNLRCPQTLRACMINTLC